MPFFVNRQTDSQSVCLSFSQAIPLAIRPCIRLHAYQSSRQSICYLTIYPYDRWSYSSLYIRKECQYLGCTSAIVCYFCLFMCQMWQVTVVLTTKSAAVNGIYFTAYGGIVQEPDDRVTDDDSSGCMIA